MTHDAQLIEPRCADPLVALCRHLADLTAAVATWETRDNSGPQPEVRQAATEAVAAVDAMVSELHSIRQDLGGDMRECDDAAAVRVDALLARHRVGA